MCYQHRGVVFRIHCFHPTLYCLLPFDFLWTNALLGPPCVS
jgi:hypothetical protein